MKRVNVKLLLILMATVAMASVGIYFLRRFQIDRNAGSVLIQARQKLEDGDAREALQLLQRYVGLRPEDSAAFAEYADLLLTLVERSAPNRADLSRTYNVLEEAVRRAPENDKLRARLAQFQLRIARFSDARDHLERLRARPVTATPPDGPQKPDDDADADGDAHLTDPRSLTLMLARAHVGLGNFETAAALAGELIGYDMESRSFPGGHPQDASTDTYVLMAGLLDEKFNDATAAAAVLETMLEVKADDPRAWLSMSRWHRRRGDIRRSQQEVTRALEIAPDDPDIVFGAFDAAFTAGDAALAEERAKKALEKFPRDERSYRGLAAVYGQQRRLDEAERVLREGLATLPSQGILYVMLADTLLQRDDIPGTEQNIARAKEFLGQFNPAIGLLEARVLVAQKRWVPAKQLLQQVRPLAAGTPDLVRQIDLYLGQCAEQLGEFDEMLDINQRVLTETPTSLPAKVGAASALMSAGKADEALAEFEAIVRGVPPDNLPGLPQVWMPLLQLRIAAQGRLPVESRDWSAIDSLLETLQGSPDVSASQVALLRADVLLRKAELDAAAALLDKAGAADPANSQIAAARGLLVLRRQGAAAARAFLAALPEDVARHPSLLTIEAQAAASEGPEAVQRLFPTIEERARSLADEPASRLFAQLAMLAMSVGDRVNAERLWEEVTAKLPDDMQARSAIFDLAVESNDAVKARMAAEALTKAAGAASPQSRVARAAVEVMDVRQTMSDRQVDGQPMPELTPAERQKLDSARNLLIEAENDRPGWNRIQILFAEVEGLKGDVNAAIDRLQQAIALGSTNPTVVKQLVSLLYGTNRIEEARLALASVGDEAQGLERISAEVELRAGKLQDAVTLAERTVAADSQNADELLWLGQLLERSGKRDQALTTVERAVEAAPERPETWLTLLSLQVAEGKRKAAEQTLARAATALTGSKREVAIAQGNEMLGRLEEAEAAYRAAEAAAPGDVTISRRLAEFLLRAGRLGAARKTLDSIVEARAESTTDRSAKSWARRMVAELVAERGTFQDFQAALKTLRLNADSRGRLGPDDMALEARLLAGRPEPASWRQGIETFQALAAVQPLSMGQKLQLAQLQERTGDWEECRTGLIAIASSPSTPPPILAMVIEKFIEHGETSTARTWFRRLQNAAGEAPATIAVEAKLAIAEGDRATAVAAAKRLMPTADTTGEQLTVIARLYEELNFTKASDKLFRQLAESSVEGVALRAAFLGRQKQAAAALDLLEGAWDNLPLERVMQIALEAVRDGEDPALANRLDSWFDKAIRQDPESVTLPLLLAELRDIQGRPAEVEKVYRDLLARPRLDPTMRAIVTNNLAFHLARPDKVAEARTLIDAAIDELGPHPDLLDTRGMVALAAGDIRQALSDLEEATLQPTATKLLHLAVARLQAGDAEAAAKALDAARKKQLRPTRLSTMDRERLGTLEAALARPAA